MECQIVLRRLYHINGWTRPEEMTGSVVCAEYGTSEYREERSRAIGGKKMIASSCRILCGMSSHFLTINSIVSPP